MSKMLIRGTCANKECKCERHEPQNKTKQKARFITEMERLEDLEMELKSQDKQFLSLMDFAFDFICHGK